MKKAERGFLLPLTAYLLPLQTSPTEDFYPFIQLLIQESLDALLGRLGELVLMQLHG